VAENLGGALSMGASSTLTIDGAEIEHNSATSGGGIALQASTLKCERSSEDESASGGCNLRHNAASNSGGGLFVKSATHLDIADSEISDNTADLGGGVFADFTQIVSLNRVNLRGNHARMGGALKIENCQHTTLNWCQVEDNVAQEPVAETTEAEDGADEVAAVVEGGGVHCSGFILPVLNMVDSVFSRNVANSTARTEGVGGGLVAHDCTGTQTRTRFRYGTANSAGGIWWTGIFALRLDSGEITANRAT
jgi:hypothetical protein